MAPRPLHLVSTLLTWMLLGRDPTPPKAELKTPRRLKNAVGPAKRSLNVSRMELTGSHFRCYAIYSTPPWSNFGCRTPGDEESAATERRRSDLRLVLRPLLRRPCLSIAKGS